MAKKISKDNMFFGLKLDPQQEALRDAIYGTDYDVIFVNAKAGTGKTLISVATAKLMVAEGRYSGLVYIVSPTQEQKQGFLPGNINEKTLPYSEPLEQALMKINENPMQAIKQCAASSNKEGKAWVDCISHTFLRGTNFENVIVIIDEFQNSYVDEAKKMLTRCHDNCKVICIGHSGQNDLYRNPQNSGFVKYLEHFKDQERCAVCELTLNYRGWISTHADGLE
jgi:predicted ribonuclease YlaK